MAKKEQVLRVDRTLIFKLQSVIGDDIDPVSVLGALLAIAANTANQTGHDEDDFAGMARATFQAVEKVTRHRKG
jgi:hypothetical protein